MAIADTITSMQTHTSNAYSMIGYGTDLTGINKNLENLSTSIFNAFLEALRTPDTLFTNLPKKSGTGANITLNDTANAPMRIELGASELTQYSENYITSSTRSGNILYFNSATTTTDYIFPAGTYTISFTNSNNPSVYVRSANTDSTSLGSGSPKTITMTEPFNVWLYRSGMTDNETTNIKLLSNAPSPTTPQDIHTISGSNKVIINGSQLFDKDNADIVTGYIDGTTGELLLGGTSKATREYIAIIPNIDMNISGFNNIVLAFYNKDKTFIERVLTASSSYTFNRNAYYIRIQGTGDTFNADAIMLNKGTSALPYEPYTSQEADIDLGVENLLPPPINNTQSNNGMTLYTDINNNYKLFGTATGNTTPRGGALTKDYVIKNGDYLHLCNSKIPTGTIQIVGVSSSITQIFAYSINSINKIIDLSSYAGSTLRYLQFYCVSGESVDTTFTPMILNNISSIKNYTPYGKAIEYCKKGNYEDKFIRTSGKNKLSPTASPVNETISNVKREGQDGIYKLSGTASGGGGSAVKYTLAVPYTIQEGDYIHFCNNVSDANSSFNLFSDNENFFSYIPSPANRIVSLSSYVGKKITAIGFYNNGSFNNTIIFTPMILNTNEATEFEPYGANEWYIKKNIPEKVFDGTENWSYVDYRGNYYRYMIPSFQSGSGVRNVISNYFPNRPSSQAIGEYNFIQLAGNDLYIQIENQTTLNDFKTWLSTHNTNVYYPLATPTYTQITGTLAEQLEYVYQKMLSQKGQTNISQVNNDLAFNMSVQAIEE